jgi:hypothetical protein
MSAAPESDYMPVPSWSELHFIANGTYATVATVVLGTALLLLIMYSVVEWWRTGRPTLCLCLIGGAVASLVEPLWDQMGRLFIYEHGVGAGYVTVAERVLPYWLIAPYSIFVGGTAYLVYRIARDERPRIYFYGAVGATIALNLLFEIPLTHARLYVYFGEQAFSPTGFPAAWAFMNLGGVLSGLALAKAPQVFSGVGSVLITPLVTMSFVAWEMGVGWPVYVVNSSTTAAGPVYLAASAAISTSIALIYIIGRIAFPTHTAPVFHEGVPISQAGQR